MFAGYASCVDWPSAYYWRELVDFYPEARVVLTYRSAESWWQSFEKTIVPGIQASVEPESLGIALIRDKVFGGRLADRDHAIALYDENVKAVRATVPPERLLVHNLGTVGNHSAHTSACPCPPSRTRAATPRRTFRTRT